MQSALDWNYFLALAWRHGLMPLANKHLLRSFSDLVPADHLEKARADFTHNAARNVLLASELCAILEELERCRISALAYKGPALAQQIYGDPNLRSFVDLDVLIRPPDVKRAGELLAKLGYRPHLELTRAQEAMLFRSECDRVYLKDGRNLMLELHWAILPPFFAVRLEIKDLLASSASVRLCGRDVRVPSLERSLLLLCLNGAKDLWCALEPICALNELIQSHPKLDWDQLRRVATDAGAQRMLLTGLALARKLFDTPLPEDILRHIERARAVEQLTNQALRNLTVEAVYKPGLWAKTRYRVRSRERLSDKVRYVAIKLLTPTHQDCVPELPIFLSFLYYGLRPLRLMWNGAGGKAARLVV